MSMFGKGMDFRFLMQWVSQTALVRSNFIEKYWDLMQAAIKTERQKKDKDGKPMMDEKNNPIIEENPVEEQYSALFMLMSYSENAKYIPVAYIQVLNKQVRYIHRIEKIKLKSQHAIEEAKGIAREKISIVAKVLAVDLTKFSAPTAGLFEEMAKAESQSSSALMPPSSVDRWKNG